MSKQGTARSRAEKTRSTANTILAPISTDIVPGKYNDHDWNITLDRESSEEYINAIVESILQNTDQHIHEKYLKSQIIPFTVNLAKHAMIKIIEWDFLTHDTMEGDELKTVWAEDDEPQSCKIDSWAQGYFPKRQASFLYSPRRTDMKECLDDEISKLEESEEELEELSTRIVADIGDSKITSPDIKEKEESLECESKYESDGDIEVEADTNNDRSLSFESGKPKKRIFKPYIGKIKYHDLEMLTETLYETEMRLELEKRKREARLNRSPGSQSTTSRQIETVDYEKKVIQKLFQTSVKDYQHLHTSDILLNANEQLVSLMKIPVEQLMTQKVKANHKMLEISSLRKAVPVDKEKSSIDEKVVPRPSKLNEVRVPTIQSDKHPLPVSMLDSIDPVPGVVVQEGDRLKKSVSKKVDRTKQIEKEFLKLRPIKTQSIPASFLIDDIIHVNQIQIKPIASSTPIPAILSGSKR